MFARFFGALLRHRKKAGITEGEQSAIRLQAEGLISDHRLEVTRYLKEKRRGSILDFVQYLAGTYTAESLREFQIYAPGLVASAYARAHNLNEIEHSHQMKKISACFKDAVFLDERLADIYEFEDEEDLQNVSWDDLYCACAGALQAEAGKKKYRNLNLTFSDEARTLGCFVAAVLLAGDLKW